MRHLAAFTLGTVLLYGQPAAVPNSSEPLRKLAFLFGKWTGIAGGKDTPLGAGVGTFSFEPRLNGKIVLRQNVAEYASGPRHDDLMVIYLDSPNEAPRAIYFDSEGHVIRYHLVFPSANNAVFESDETQPGPRYRLSYRLEKDILSGEFEIAPPGSGYQTYMSWTSKKL